MVDADRLDERLIRPNPFFPPIVVARELDLPKASASAPEGPRFDRGIDFPGGGKCLPVVTIDVDNGQVLMVAWMNQLAYAATLDEGRAVYYSRSRRELWRKGDTSGHVQKVHDIRLDCDGDTILIVVHQIGAACHEGYRSCFFRGLDSETGRYRIDAPPPIDLDR